MATATAMHARYRIVLLALVVASSPSARAQLWERARAGGGPDSDHAFDVAVTTSGDVYATGGYGGAATFGSTTIMSAGGIDAFLVRYEPDGDVAWVRSAGGTAEDRGRGVAVDADGNVYVVGGFFGTATFGTESVTSAGSRDIYLAKYTAGGDVLWVRRAGGAQDDFGLFVSLDAVGNPIITGRFQQTADFGSSSLTSAGGNDAFVARYTPAGDVTWARRGGSATPAFFELGLHTLVDADGDIHVTGRFESTADFGSFTLDSDGAGDVFLVTYSPDGAVLRALRGGGAGDDFGHGLAAASDGGLYLTGWFDGAAIFDLESLTGFGGLDAFLVKYSADGSAEWARNAGGTGEDRGYGAAVAPDGTVITGGLFSGTAAWGSLSATSDGGADAFVARYSADGTALAVDRAGGTGADITYLMESAGPHVVAAGQFSGEADFGPTLLVGAGGLDAFAAWLNAGPVANEPGPLGFAVRLDAPRPSPSRGLATVAYELTEATHGRLGLVDVTGREVRVVAIGPALAGRHELALEVDDLPAGVYLMRLEAAGQSVARTITVVR